MAHWAEGYVGMAYIPGELDCAVLAERVSREVFGRALALPHERASGGPFALPAQIQAALADYAERTDTPEEGDGVLLRARGRLTHIGIYCRIQGEPYVLHAVRGAGQVLLHAVRRLPSVGFEVEGYYRWLP